MDSAFNADFPPNTLVCVHFVFLVKSHLAIGSRGSDSLSLSFASFLKPISSYYLVVNTQGCCHSFLWCYCGGIAVYPCWFEEVHEGFSLELSVIVISSSAFLYFVYFCDNQGLQTSPGTSEVSLCTHSWSRAREVLVSILWEAAGQESCSRSTVWLQVDLQHSRQVKIQWTRKHYCMEKLARNYC